MHACYTRVYICMQGSPPSPNPNARLTGHARPGRIAEPIAVVNGADTRMELVNLPGSDHTGPKAGEHEGHVESSGLVTA